ncbi:hypothetical protein [Aminobacter sp. MDW-2]|uniref:hypothetical protein n=1 Tax=Aminobacter sp. MDW-2 TaxID=2666139 RepID=UPI0012AFE0E3|nr:hypothetical protein [Aminobacter sp. MDW-2]MRX32781.1 hypothetical protein [Aminobacter sp. MDW-2]QNH34557.1 hypothetical protein H5P29_00970 [Aminobacter sp. MDW-2]
MSPRNSRVTATHVIYGFWLVFEEGGGVRLTRTEPALDRAERSMFLNATLPRSLWNTPTLRANIGVKHGPEGGFNIDLDVAADALRAALGVDVDLRVIEGE